VAIPRKSKPSAARREFEHWRAFREKVKWRSGSEERINHIGCNRTELTGIRRSEHNAGKAFRTHLVKSASSQHEARHTSRPAPTTDTPQPADHADEGFSGRSS